MRLHIDCLPSPWVWEYLVHRFTLKVQTLFFCITEGGSPSDGWSSRFSGRWRLVFSHCPLLIGRQSIQLFLEQVQEQFLHRSAFAAAPATNRHFFENSLNHSKSKGTLICHFQPFHINHTTQAEASYIIMHCTVVLILLHTVLMQICLMTPSLSCVPDRQSMKVHPYVHWERWKKVLFQLSTNTYLILILLDDRSLLNIN